MKKRLFIDMDGVLANIKDQHSKFAKLFPGQPYVQSQYGFFLGMEPIQDSIESVKELIEQFDVWILTAPSWKNPMCLAEKNYWIRENFGIELCEKIIMCSDKSICQGDYLIDDNDCGRGQENFSGELIHFTSSKFPTWIEVMAYLM